MSRYLRKDEALRRKPYIGEILKFGWDSVHNIDANYNWVVGFCNKNEDMVYVPHGAKLIGKDNVEYQLVLEEDPKTDTMLNHETKTGEYLAFLKGKEKRFGLEAQITIPLEYAFVLRFNESIAEESIFRVKSLPAESLHKHKPRAKIFQLFNRQKQKPSSLVESLR